jgi:poly-gamma-glutamate synthesis protein (capsule biosynthesis protein)
MNDRKYYILAFIFIFLAGVFYFLGQKYPENRVPITNNGGQEEADAAPIRSLFVGDIMLDRTVRTTIEKHGFEYPFEDIKNIFGGQDMVVGNLEGAITSKPSVSQKDFSILKFTFPSSDARGLKDLGFSGFSLANNHAHDFGQEGFLETLTNLGLGELFSFGSPSNDRNLSTKVNVKGEDICMVGYHALYSSTTTQATEEIRRIKPDCDFVIVYAHWGIEYEDNENKRQREIGHELVDAGADLIIGAHPHVIQPVEIYKNKAIFYSIGNFIFDQDFSLATRQGLAVQMELGADKVTYGFIPVEMYRNKLSFPSKQAFVSRMSILTQELPLDMRNRALEAGQIVLDR